MGSKKEIPKKKKRKKRKKKTCVIPIKLRLRGPKRGEKQDENGHL